MRVLTTGLLAGLVVLGLVSGAASQTSSATSKKVCDVESAKREAMKNDGLRSALAGPVTSSRCASLLVILKQIASGKILAGRQLEGNVAADRADAQRQLDAARANAEIQAAVAAEWAGVTDAQQRVLLEAVVMHDKRQLLARNLLIQQLDPERPL
ncbi:hypothetical protein GCM10007242_03030 [Pigmentiphaga litoralis]|uniref:hypothetical protein n=1 Tax=Pigmentiphaga litoralis TaxID=516702 RepID=UPI0016754AD1|nr:hypothetical protein [Pigmentiphaga litoralis]GGX01525.1 hypothetical protein GCM10007242_03030 [Pigmentiphaga litoralis]